MATSSVSHITIEYSDGSYDNIIPLQNGESPVFSLDRKIESDKMVSLGAHSAGAIAALLYITAMSNQRTKYSPVDPRVGSLYHSWIEVTKKNSNKTKDE